MEYAYIYITAEKINKFNPNIPDLCYKCNTDKGTLYHCLWECVHIQCFWRSVVGCISRMVSSPIQVCPELCILGIYLTGCNVLTPEKKINRLLFITCKTCHCSLLEKCVGSNYEYVVETSLVKPCSGKTHLQYSEKNC